MRFLVPFRKYSKGWTFQEMAWDFFLRLCCIVVVVSAVSGLCNYLITRPVAPRMVWGMDIFILWPCWGIVMSLAVLIALNMRIVGWNGLKRQSMRIKYLRQEFMLGDKRRA